MEEFRKFMRQKFSEPRPSDSGLPTLERTDVLRLPILALETPPAPEDRRSDYKRDYASAVDLVRQVAASCRAADDWARKAQAQADHLMKHAREQIRRAEDIVKSAEDQVRVAEANAEAADARARDAEARAEDAERRAQEAQDWLTRVFDTMEEEFASIRVEPPRAPVAEAS